MTQKFTDFQLSRLLEHFANVARLVLKDRLISVVLHGSVIFNDLAPGYGDLDFVAVVDGDLSEEDQLRLIELRGPFWSGEHGIYGKMLEGPFLPRKMLDPATSGKALCWGTGGNRIWEKNKLGGFVLHLIREQGLVIWGADIRKEIPVASRRDLVEDLAAACQQAQEHGQGGSLHSIDWLLTAARSLVWLKEGRLVSKSDAAEWGAINARGNWRVALPECRNLRLNPRRGDSQETQKWLDALGPIIRDAWAEVSGEMKHIAGGE